MKKLALALSFLLSTPAMAIDVEHTSTPITIDGVSESAKEKYRKFLKERTPLAIDLVILNPGFLYVALDTTVYHNTKISDATSSEIDSLVRNSIASYNTTSLNNFKKKAFGVKLAAWLRSMAIYRSIKVSGQMPARCASPICSTRRGTKFRATRIIRPLAAQIKTNIITALRTSKTT